MRHRFGVFYDWQCPCAGSSRAKRCSQCQCSAGNRGYSAFSCGSTQNTPISITALSGKTLETRGIQSVEGIARSAPNVTLEKNSAGYGKSVIAYIRGVGKATSCPLSSQARHLY
jgi:hypothetical protein